MSTNFHCRKWHGDPDFSIEEWNETAENLDKIDISEEERNKILFPHTNPCENQCFDCMADVGERRKRTQELIKTLNNS